MQKSRARALPLLLSLALLSTGAAAQTPPQNYVLKVIPSQTNTQAVDLEACALNDQTQAVTQCWAFFSGLSTHDLQNIADRLEDQRNWRVLGLTGSVIAGAVVLVSSSALAYMASGAVSGASGPIAGASAAYHVAIVAPGIVVENLGLSTSIPPLLGAAVVASGPLFWSSVGHYITAGKADGINPSAYHRAMRAAANLPEGEQKIDRKSLTKLLKAIRHVKGIPAN